MLKRLTLVLGIIVYAIITVRAIKNMYDTFIFFKPLFALLNFNRLTYCWGAFTYGFIDGYFFYHKREQKVKNERKN